MAINVPRRNLGGEAEPWGRSVDERLLKQQGAIDLLQKDMKNSFKGINASISGISRALTAVQAQQEELEHQQEALEEQQNTLEQQQADLQTQTNKLSKTITGLPRHQYAFDSWSGSGGITTTERTILSAAITIPAAHDYGWHVPIVIGTIYADAGATGTLYIKTTISNGAASGSSTDAYYLPESRFNSINLAFQGAAVFTSNRQISVEVSIWKNVPGDSFSTMALSASLSELSYAR